MIIDVMIPTRVIVANELRSYREAISQVFGNLRPNVEVFVIEPEDLDWEVARLRPNLVVCSRATFMVKFCAPVWIELYPNREALSRISILTEVTTVEEIHLTDLLSLLDQTQGLATTLG